MLAGKDVEVRPTIDWEVSLGEHAALIYIAARIQPGQDHRVAVQGQQQQGLQTAAVADNRCSRQQAAGRQ